MPPFCAINSIMPINNDEVYEPDAHTLFLCPVDPSFYSVHKFILTRRNSLRRYYEDLRKAEEKDNSAEAKYLTDITLRTKSFISMRKKQKSSGSFTNNMLQAYMFRI